jgi:alkyldihydroxyacetonephosphate synthase
MTARTRSWWGWGWEDEAVPDAEMNALGGRLAERFGVPLTVVDPPQLADLALRLPRVEPPAALADRCSATPFDRAGHTYGKSFRDLVRALRGDLGHAPDLVAFPQTEADVVALLDWCTSANVAAIPYGGGSSVVGGIEGDVGDDFAGVVSIDLSGLGEVLEVDPVSRAARIQAGALGPQLESQLRPHGYTLRHFPQSFELSTLGGWLATRSGGHYASVYTHIDDFVESLRVVTPTGVSESRRLPGSGAGPSPDRLFLGSEGSLGIITEAWMRVQNRPRWRASAGVVFDRYIDGVNATRALSQSGLFPTNCRLLDGGEAAAAAGTSGVAALLVLGFESADHPVDAWIERAIELCRDHSGTIPAGVSTSDQSDSSQRARDDAVGSWRSSFLRAPYLRNALVRCGMILETFETACPWSAFEELHAGVTTTVTDALQRICGGGAMTCRFTHVYPDGPAPYFSIAAPGRPGSELEMWDEIKIVASDAVLAHGGTITHHHAVGRDHDPWYREQRPELFGRALDAAKAALDPAGVLNPGVIAGSRP